MSEEAVPNVPTLPVVVAEAAIQVLDKKPKGDPDIYTFHREDLYNMLRDISRMTAQLAWEEGVRAAEAQVGNYETIDNPYEGTYWEEDQ